MSTKTTTTVVMMSAVACVVACASGADGSAPTSAHAYGSALSAVDAISANDAWAVGYDVGGLIERWNGSAWTRDASGDTPNASYRDVDVRTTTDGWAVGDVVGAPFHPPVAMHYDGDSWTQVPIPTLKGKYTFLDGVTSIKADDAWAVGSGIDGKGHPPVPLIEHWNGATWSKVTGGEVGAHCRGSLSDVSATSPDDVWAVGTTGCGRALVEHWDGRSWTLERTPDAPRNHDLDLEAVAAVSATDVWIVGSVSSLKGAPEVRSTTLTEHFDGSGWTVVASPNSARPTCLANHLQSVSASATGDVWAAGWVGCGKRLTSQYNLLMRWNGSGWALTRAPGTGGTPSDDTLSGVVAVSPTLAWAVGSGTDQGGDDGGRIDAWDGVRWVRQ